ncbi:MAG TPA: anthranilate phosphoribosyltransferase [Methanoregulaceae archaeon]|nr:anthranilate phosphoribosyltransferase [Methanoregulaceae archaeon]
MMQAVLARIAAGRNLSVSEASAAMELIATGKATEAQMGAFLTGLRFKGETAEEIAAFADVLQRHAISIKPRVEGILVDTCGTGGDGFGTFNISTAAALVAAGAGVTVVKHGNRKVSSSCGSADVLEALGVKVDLPPEQVSRMVENIGIGFLFAPAFHPALRYAARARRDLGFSTVFNVLGPLLNPARASARLLGVFDPRLTLTLAQALRTLGAKKAMVVHGDGLDEITISGKTSVAELANGNICQSTLTPEQFGISRAPRHMLLGHSPDQNAAIIRGILDGVEGPARDIVVMNAGAAIYLGERASTHEEGIALAGDAITSGAAAAKLDDLIVESGRKI